MNETFSPPSAEKREDNEPNYEQAAEQALTGYAHDGGAWLHGKEVFQQVMQETGSPDAALREALAVASDQAESSPEEAAGRFWNVAEGENGFHARYEQAIEQALRGYAHDGGAWLHGKDTFFNALRDGRPTHDALSEALAIASENAQSTVWSAENRFWYEAGPEATSAPSVDVETLEVAPSAEKAERPILEAIDHWPAETSEIGGSTSRIEFDEAEDVFERVEIRGDGRLGELTPELLEKAGLLPRHRLEIEDRTMWFSPGYDIGEGRMAAVGYVEEKDGTVVARSYYRSNSQGSWRYLPKYWMMGGRLSLYDKGYGEESVTLPAALQEGLTRALDDDGGIIELDQQTAETAFTGTARHITEEGTSYHRLVAEKPLTIAGVPEVERGKLPAPETVRPEFEHVPRFDQVLASWEQATDLYGQVTYEVIPSNDGTLRYTFCRDARGRAWVGSVENDSPIVSTGLHETWVSGGALTTPAYEYGVQSGEYGNVSDMKGSYVDMFEGYLSKIPTIQNYVASVEARQAA